jgi:hypothetical protein
MFYDAAMGERVDFWELLRLPRRTVEAWLYTPAAGVPVRVELGRLTGDPARPWVVLVGHKEVDCLICRDEAEARTAMHDQGAALMALCGPGRWTRTAGD